MAQMSLRTVLTGIVVAASVGAIGMNVGSAQQDGGNADEIALLRQQLQQLEAELDDVRRDLLAQEPEKADDGIPETREEAPEEADDGIPDSREAALEPMTVQAPFVVLGKSGDPLLEVSDLGLIYSPQSGVGFVLQRGSEAVAVMDSDSAGGRLQLFSSGGTPLVQLGIASNNAGTILLHDSGGQTFMVLGGDNRSIRIGPNQEERVVMGEDKGNFGFHLKDTGGNTTMLMGSFDGRPDALRVLSGGKSVAAVGQIDGTGVINVSGGGKVGAALVAAAGGGGSVAVYDTNGGIRATLSTVENPDGAIMLLNDSAMGVAYLTGSTAEGGGNITLTDSSGRGVFSAGATTDGGGEACVNRVRSDGKEMAACLGVGLPGMGQGK